MAKSNINPRVNKKQKQKQAEKSSTRLPVQNFEIKYIEAKTDNQSKAFDAWDNGKNLFLLGSPGTGKTFIGLYLAMAEALDNNQKVYIVRSAVPSRDMGFMPGNAKEKAEMYEAPYARIVSELFGRGDAYKTLVTKGVIEFITTSYLRGITLDNCIIVVDECQNMSAEELHTIVSRIGVNSSIIFSGDFKQTDLIKHHDKSGLKDFAKILQAMDEFAFIEFDHNDILRSDLVKSYIIIREKLEAQGVVGLLG